MGEMAEVVMMSWALRRGGHSENPVQRVPFTKSVNTHSMPGGYPVFGVNGKPLCPKNTGREEEQAISVQRCRANWRGIEPSSGAGCLCGSRS